MKGIHCRLKLLKSKYGISLNRWDANPAVRAPLRSPRKSISSLYEELYQLISFKVGRYRY